MNYILTVYSQCHCLVKCHIWGATLGDPFPRGYCWHLHSPRPFLSCFLATPEPGVMCTTAHVLSSWSHWCFSLRFWALTGSPLGSPRAYRILSLFPQAQKKLSVWLRGELFLPLFLSVNFFPLLTSSIGPPNSPLGRAGITGWWMRNSPLDTLKIVDFLIFIFLNCCIKILFNLDCWGVIIIFGGPLNFVAKDRDTP